MPRSVKQREIQSQIQKTPIMLPRELWLEVCFSRITDFCADVLKVALWCHPKSLLAWMKASDFMYKSLMRPSSAGLWMTSVQIHHPGFPDIPPHIGTGYTFAKLLHEEQCYVSECISMRFQ